MKASIPKSKRPLPSSPWRLYGSFNPFLDKRTAREVLDEFVRRAELTVNPEQRQMQAQRAIGALMALTSFGVKEALAAETHQDIFARLSTLTGETPDALVTIAGVEI